MNIINADTPIMWHQDHFLRKPSRELTREEVLSPEFKDFIKVMFSSLYEDQTGVGLAAPQLGIQLRVVVIDIKRNRKKPLVLINPSFEPLSPEIVESTETCLSFCGYVGNVKRYRKIKVKAKNLAFEDIEFETDSFLALVCQHEINHLDGIVYVDKADKVYSAQNRYEVMANEAIGVLTGNR